MAHPDNGTLTPRCQMSARNPPSLPSVGRRWMPTPLKRADRSRPSVGRAHVPIPIPRFSDSSGRRAGGRRLTEFVDRRNDRSASGKRDSSAQRQTAQNRLQARNGRRGDTNATAKARQLRASRPSPGNLLVRTTAWWAWQDSNFQSDRYELASDDWASASSDRVPSQDDPSDWAGLRRGLHSEKTKKLFFS
jgi:hypothetical protein